MTKGSSLILRIYFGVVSAVTLFTLMWGAIDFLTLGLKSFVFTAADAPSYLMNCDDPNSLTGYYGKPVSAPETTEELTPEEQKARCEAANATAWESYRTDKANNAVHNLALILVSLPLFVLHFRVVYRDWNDERKA